jgi:hypothetical protein
MSGTHSIRKLRRVRHERISIDQVEWQRTFPHLVQPRLDEDESLPGFLLRCDDVNGWPCGFTFGFTSFGQVPIELSMTALVAPTVVDCQVLADALALDAHDIEATTYLSEITTLFSLGSERPLPAHIGKPQLFRVCPRCLAEDHLVRRSAALEGLSHCIVHHIALCDRCECGWRLVPFPAGAIRLAGPSKLLCDPYVCVRCGLGWENLPCTRGDTTVLREEQRLAELYTAILSDPSVALLDRVFPCSNTDRQRKTVG